MLQLSSNKTFLGETAFLLLLQRWNFPCKLVRLMYNIFNNHFSTISLAVTGLVAINIFKTARYNNFNMSSIRTGAEWPSFGMREVSFDQRYRR